jgi:hypothetical protein
MVSSDEPPSATITSRMLAAPRRIANVAGSVLAAFSVGMTTETCLSPQPSPRKRGEGAIWIPSPRASGEREGPAGAGG